MRFVNYKAPIVCDKLKAFARVLKSIEQKVVFPNFRKTARLFSMNNFLRLLIYRRCRLNKHLIASNHY